MTAVIPLTKGSTSSITTNPIKRIIPLKLDITSLRARIWVLLVSALEAVTNLPPALAISALDSTFL